MYRIKINVESLNILKYLFKIYIYDDWLWSIYSTHIWKSAALLKDYTIMK